MPIDEYMKAACWIVCPMCFEETAYYNEGNYPDGSECWDVCEQTVDRTVYNGFCNFGERRDGDAD